MELQTTTYKGRHVALLERAAALVTRPDGRGLCIMEAGPGLSVKYLGRMARVGSPVRPVAKGIETVVRRLPLPDAWLENYETVEIIAAFGPRTAVTVVDINPRTVGILGRRFASRGVTGIRADLASAAFLETPGLAAPFDVAIALSTLGRIPPHRQAAAAGNLAAAVAPGGLVLEDMIDMTAHGRLEALGAGIYRRLP